jgi:uncharacterized membrane protein YbjE (DUF340 family)
MWYQYLPRMELKSDKSANSLIPKTCCLCSPLYKALPWLMTCLESHHAAQTKDRNQNHTPSPCFQWLAVMKIMFSFGILTRTKITLCSRVSTSKYELFLLVFIFCIPGQMISNRRVYLNSSLFKYVSIFTSSIKSESWWDRGSWLEDALIFPPIEWFLERVGRCSPWLLS